MRLVCCSKFFEETLVVFREHAQVANLILEVGDTLNAKTEGIARILLGVDATEFEYVGVNHTATENFYPACMLAEAATCATADVARDVHLGTWLGEGEIGWAQTYLGVWAEELTCKGEHDLLEVGEADVLVDIESFYLVEEAVGTGCDSLVTIHSAWTDNTYRGLLLLHNTCLNTGGVATQEDILGDVAEFALFHEESVLHIACRVVSGKIHLGEDMEVVFYLWSVGKGEAHALEYLYYLILDDRERMASAKLNRVGGTGKVECLLSVLLSGELVTQTVDFVESECLDLIDKWTKDAFVLWCYIAKVCHEVVDGTLA